MVVLDGGMGHQLKAMGVKIEGKVGTLGRFLGVCHANTNDPELVVAAHLSFIDAGAEVITTNSYAVTPRVLALCPDPAVDPQIRLEQLLRAACNAACTARERRKGRKVQIAGCLPPLAESYRPDLVGGYSEILATYRTIAATIAPDCDLLLAETMSTVDEARAACTAASETGLPVWVAWTLDETSTLLRSGESVADAVAALAPIPNMAGFLFGCSSPEAVSAALPLLRNAPTLPPEAKIGGYANGFVTAAGGQGEYRDLSDEEYYTFVKGWLGSGATIVGGCCGIFPRHIEYLAKQVATMRASQGESLHADCTFADWEA